MEWVTEKYLEGYSIKELAEATGLSISKVWTLINDETDVKNESIIVPDVESLTKQELGKWIIESHHFNHNTYKNIAKSLGITYRELTNIKKNCSVPKNPELKKTDRYEKKKSVGYSGKECRVIAQDVMDWAIQKRKEGYTIEAIANAIGINHRSFEEHLKGVPINRKPVKIDKNCNLDDIIRQLRIGIKNNYSLRELCIDNDLNYSVVYRRLGKVEREKLTYDDWL